jgi:outer membrane protein assembly factor BamB
MKRHLRLVAAALGCAALAGCAVLGAGANPEVPLWVHRGSGSMELTYSRSLLAASRDVGEPYERGAPELDVLHRRIFVGSRDQGLYAISAPDGEVLWRFETLGPSQSEPLYDAKENVVYFGSNDGSLYKVNADDGRLRWRFSTNAEVARRPVLLNGVIYAANANDTIIALNASTGALIWAQHRTPALGMEVAGYAGVLVWRGLVYSAFSDGTVTAFDARTGEERWAPVDLTALAEQSLEEVPTYLDVDTTPVADTIDGQPVIYAGSYEGGVYALSADVGSRVWGNDAVRGASELLLWEQPSYTPRGGGPPVPERKLLIASTGTSGLWALDPATGREVWRRALPDGGASRAVPILGALMVSTTRQGLFMLSPLDGTIIDGIHTGDGFAMPPATYGRRAFIVSNHTRLLSIHVTPPI